VEQGILGDLLAFLILRWSIFTTLGEMIDPNKIMNPQHMRRNLADIQKSELESTLDALAEVCAP